MYGYALRKVIFILSNLLLLLPLRRCLSPGFGFMRSQILLLPLFYSPVAVFCQSVLLFATSFCLELLHSLSFATWKKSTQSITEAKRHNHLYHHTAVVQFQHRCVCLSRFIINWIINWPLPGMKYEAYSFEIQKQPEMMLTSNKFWLTFLELHNTYCVLLSDRLNRIFNAMACPIPICHMRKKVTIYNNVI